MSRFMILSITAICISAIIGCNLVGEDYELSERENPYDPEVPWGSETPSVRPLTTDGISDSPSWSRDGTLIAFHNRADLSIYVMDAAGSHPEKLEHLEGHSSEGRNGVKWSPKADRIAYIHEPYSDISVRDYPKTKTEPEQLTEIGSEDGTCSSLVWSPDGDKIAYVQGGKLKIVTVATKSKEELEPTLNSVEPIESMDRVSDWSPDGNQIMAISAAQAYKIDVARDTGNRNHAQLLSPEKGGLVTNAVWSEDGLKILYVSFNFGRYELWIIDPEGNQAAILTRDTMIEEEELLFGFRAESHADSLDREVVSDGLREKFGFGGISLSAEAEIHIQNEGTHWQIMDGRITHIVRKEQDLLKVYGHYTKNAEFIGSISWSPTDESNVLFVGSPELGGQRRNIFLLKMKLR